MNIFRKFLIKIRAWDRDDRKKFYLISLSVLLLSIAAGIAADMFLPFNGWWNALRSLILIPTSFSLFSIGYAMSLYLHYRKVNTDSQWTPFRARTSPMWRRRIALIIAAVLFVIVYSNGYGVGYTFSSSALLAVGLALLAYIRTNREESLRERLDIPDARDVVYNEKFNELLKEKQAASLAKKEAKNQKRRRFLPNNGSTKVNKNT